MDPPTRSDPPAPRVATQNALIVEASPLAIIGIFVVFLQERFREGNGPTAYTHHPNHTQSKIIIESAFEDTRAERGSHPAIYVDKDSSTFRKISIGDRSQFSPKSGKNWGTCHSHMPIRIECVSANKGESATIGDLVHTSTMMASDVIQAAFNLHDITPPVLSRTIPYEEDTKVWNSVVTFSVVCTMNWSTLPISPVLQECVLRIQGGAGDASPTQHLIDIATRSRGLP
jgi:hypothetical protein